MRLHIRSTGLTNVYSNPNSAPTAEAVENLRRGVIIDKRKTNPAKIKWTGGNVLKISITEGRNRQIRRMVKAVGYEVISLKRIQIGMISLKCSPWQVAAFDFGRTAVFERSW